MPIPPANLIDIGTDEDAGFWSDALCFAPFPHTDYPAPTPARDTAAGATPAPAAFDSPVFHDEPNSLGGQHDPA